MAASEDVRTTPPLLDSLLRTPGPSGYEVDVASVWRREASRFAEVTSDGIGSSVARAGEPEARPLLSVVGHIDEIGLAITHVDEKGFLYFAAIGGWDPQVLVGQRVEIATKNGPVAGVAGRKPIHLLDPDQRKKAAELKSMHIDIGAGSKDEALALIRIGDPVVIAGEPQPLAGGRLVSRAMDNRLGAYVALEALRRCSERDAINGQFAAVAGVQEEIGLHGAKTSSFQIRPDLAVAIDVTHATDAPGIEEKELGSHELGSGPTITRGSTLSPTVFEMLVEAAEAEQIPHTLAASGTSSHTDADAIQVSRTGVPTGLVSIPLRYMHSPVEMVDLADVEATVELIAAFAARIPAGWPG